MHLIKLPSGYRLALVAILTLLFRSDQIQASPKLLNSGLNHISVSDTELVEPSADSVSLFDDLQNKLAEARAELADQLLVDNSNKVTSQNPEFPRRLFLQMLTHGYEVQLQRIKELKDRQQQFARWQKETNLQSQQTLATTGSFLQEDGVRESLVINDKRLARLNQMHDYVEQEIMRRIELAKQSAIKLRQANEALEHSSVAEKALASEKRQMASLQYRLDAIRVVGAQIESQRIQQEALELQAQRDYAEIQYANRQSPAVMTEQDLQTMRKAVKAEQQQVMEQLEKTVFELAADKQTSGSAQVAFDADNSDGIRYAVKQTAELKLQALQWILEYLQLREVIWEYRWSYLTVSDPDKVRKAYEQIAVMQQTLKIGQQYVQQLRLLALDQVNDQRNQSESARIFNNQQQSLDLECVKILSRLLALLESNQYLLERWQQDLDFRFQVKSQAEYWRQWAVTVSERLGEIWNYELFIAEDVIEVDGQQIKGKRSITVAKIITALLILLLGYWLAVKLAQGIETIAVKRLAIDPSLARIARRWILFVELMLLAITSLMVVHIPLTVFAFMGGAVAIGAGFGMQNLLKNLISGLMLLLERPFRPGDLVEVGGIRGRITDIGVRSSHIRDGNGIETLIPNSTFIEEKVTNWTLSSQSVRISVKVGVVYGSPVQEVTEILLQAAERHGLVQDKPAPQVLLEEFGNEALLFGLYVWLELRPEVDWRLVASDLRYIINKKFVAQGITVAFPQRDVHLDLKQPLAVQVVNNP